MLSDLETWLAGVYKGAPKLSSGAKKSIVDIWPWVALVFGILQLWAALELWHWGHDANNLVNTLNSYYGTTIGSVAHLNAFYWLSWVVLIVDALILLAAFPKLRAHKKTGWNLLFYGALLDFVYGVLSAFNNYGGLSSLVFQVIITAIVLYFLFQIRDLYHGAKA
jgi:hypothetical protein